MKFFVKLKNLIRIAIAIIVLAVISIICINAYVYRVGERGFTETPEKADAIIVLGASVRGNTVSLTLAKRLDKALQMYEAGYSEVIIVSGDHGTKDYNEVRAMQKYLAERGVPETCIFMDHAGFSTYDSVYRAKEIFQVEKALVVTQREHLIRALYIADRLELSAQGTPAQDYLAGEFYVQKLREVFARVKAFLQCEILHSEPVFLGEAIPVTQMDGKVTED